MVSVFPFCRWFLCSCFPDSSPSASLPKMKIYSSERAGYLSRSSRPEGDTTGQSPACNVFGILLLKVPTLCLQSVLISCCPCRSYRPNLGPKLCISKRQSVPAHHWSQHSECRRSLEAFIPPFSLVLALHSSRLQEAPPAAGGAVSVSIDHSHAADSSPLLRRSGASSKVSPGQSGRVGFRIQAVLVFVAWILDLWSTARVRLHWPQKL